MKVLQVNNQHRQYGGSDRVADATVELLRERGVEVATLTCDSNQMGRGLQGRVKAFAYGLYSPWGWRVMQETLRRHRPDVVHVHELYPFFSPWVLKACHQAGVPVVMTCHDYRLSCPTAFHQANGQGCEQCVGGREYWCVLKNCRQNLLESVAYAWRNWMARKFQLFTNNVTIFIALTNFARSRLLTAGVPAEQIEVVPNLAEVPPQAADPAQGQYAIYLGRISPEKGLDILLDAVRQAPVPLRLAGNYAQMPWLLGLAPDNAEFVGYVNRPDLPDFFRQARLLVLPSRWFEGAPLVLTEAMSFGLPVIASKIGGIEDLVADGVNGLLVEPGNPGDLAEKIRRLWDDPELCRRLGRAGRERVVNNHSPSVHFARLTEVYTKAIRLAREGTAGNTGIS